MSTTDLLALLNHEDQIVPTAVRNVLPQLADVVDQAVERWRDGGTVHYFGAGTSGRIGAMDAAELPPTYSIPRHRVVAHMAGGHDAMLRANEALEDDRDLGATDAAHLTTNDVAIGLTASGCTPYVLGALARAGSNGALRVGVTSNPDAELARVSDHLLVLDTGPEALTGSTRLKAATAQKLVLNSFSTALMVRLGKTYSNLMVDLASGNTKLHARTIRLLREATGSDETDCQRHLAASGGQPKVALLTLLGHDADAAEHALAAQDGHVRRAITHLSGAGARERS